MAIIAGCNNNVAKDSEKETMEEEKSVPIPPVETPKYLLLQLQLSRLQKATITNLISEKALDIHGLLA